MFEQALRNIDDALRKEAGCATELDYAGQTSANPNKSAKF
jgi:type I restriction enzyme M protein